jgi:predicted O-methyltransferase YrrM
VDNGGGIVIGAEVVPQKLAAARQNLADAGLDQWIELRQGDARKTLRTLSGPVDFALIDGWPTRSGPSLARQVIEFAAPKIRMGGLVMNDDGEPDYLAYMRDPTNGFCSMSLPLKEGTELSVRVGPPQ